jgi:hypothetical protein
LVLKAGFGMNIEFEAIWFVCLEDPRVSLFIKRIFKRIEKK